MPQRACAAGSEELDGPLTLVGQGALVVTGLSDFWSGGRRRTDEFETGECQVSLAIEVERKETLRGRLPEFRKRHASIEVGIG